MAPPSGKEKAKHRRAPRQTDKRNRLGSRLATDRSLILFGTIVTLHALGVMLLFNPTSGLINPQPIIDQDWGLHFHHLNSLTAFWRQDRMAWGYNPYFMAGYPSNTIQDLSIKFFEWFAVGLSAFAFSPVQWFKLGAFLGTASLPLFLYFAARNFFFSEVNRYRLAVLAAFLGTIYWWNSLPREMFFYGVIGFPIASYLSLLGVSILYRMLADSAPPSGLFLAWLLFSAAILPMHVQSVLVFLPPMLALLALRFRLLTLKSVGWIVAAACASWVINFAWLLPAISHRGDDVSATIVKELPLFADTGWWAFIFDYVGPHRYWSFRPSVSEKGFRLALLLLGVIGIVQLHRDRKNDLAITLATASVFLFAITYFGALVTALTAWQPLRFKVPFDLFLALGAAYGIDHWLSKRSTLRPLVPITLTCGLLAFLVNLMQTETSGRFKLRSRFIPELEGVIAWVHEQTPRNARILFEESGDESGFVYDRTYLSSFLPDRTGRQMIGGPINLYNDRHHFAEFHSGKMFKQDPQAISALALRNYLRLYNVGAVVAFDPASIQRLQSIPGLVTIEQRIGPIHLMRVNQPLSWFLAGEGQVKASYNRLELSNLKGDEIVLKYHWVKGLTAEPPVRLEAVKLADDPIPFVKLVNPPAALTLRIASSIRSENR